MDRNLPAPLDAEVEELTAADFDGWTLDDIDAWIKAVVPGFRRLRLEIGAVLWKARALADEQSYSRRLVQLSDKLGVATSTLGAWRKLAEHEFALPPAGPRAEAQTKRRQRERAQPPLDPALGKPDKQTAIDTTASDGPKKPGEDPPPRPPTTSRPPPTEPSLDEPAPWEKIDTIGGATPPPPAATLTRRHVVALAAQVTTVGATVLANCCELAALERARDTLSEAVRQKRALTVGHRREATPVPKARHR